MSEHYTEEMKNKFLGMASFMQKLNETVRVSGKRFSIPAEGREIGVVYYPAETAHAPLVLGFHGGGFLFGGNALNDDMWSAVSESLGVNVASIGYRKSPDHQYRDALEDVLETVRYFRSRAEEYGFDPERIAAMGCSAGANLAATYCIYAKKKGEPPIWKQILLYPVTDMYTDPAEKGDGTLAQPLQYLFNDLHVSPQEAKRSDVSPYFAAAEDLEGLPDAFICAAENDSLKAETEEYVQKLRDAGVHVTYHTAEDMPHGFFEAGFGEISDAEIEILGPEIGKVARDGLAAETSRKVLRKLKEEI